ncbi:GTP-binding protein [Mycena venus]|uniref:GTP-binding protein n=1 Tax=Mycena venus TaxID=2733690 RepID=A0A8H6X6N0_9AGAR|nr:GTP-binding protein [Mycena venus]
MPRDADKAIALRSKCKDFRILVIGRANAGKTTLFEERSLSNVEGSAERGVHNIGNQLRFKSNRQFVFHDSRGFESGSEDELNKVTAFIAERAASKHLSDQLHAIWYCVPTDTNRPLLATDEQFFNTNITGKGESPLSWTKWRTQYDDEVPVIAIFTKFDGLLNEAFSQLMDEGDDWEDAQEGQIEQARKMLTTNFEGPLRSSEFPPADYVRLDDMRVETSNCNELIEKTANALTDNTLRLLFISVQQNNIDFCIRYAMTKGLFRETKVKALLTSTLAHFPHVWRVRCFVLHRPGRLADAK